MLKSNVKRLLADYPRVYSRVARSYRYLKHSRDVWRYRIAKLRNHSEIPEANPVPMEQPSASPPSPATAPTRIITTLEELDAQLLTVDEVGQQSDDALRQVLASFEFRVDISANPDPYSEAYRRQQHELYLKISGMESYSANNERSENFFADADEAARQPFPYYTRSPQTVGDQLMALGFIIKTMNLPSGSKILEFGPGWGNTTINLARMGYAVTAVDIEPNFLALIQSRAKMLHLSVKTICGNFSDAVDQESPDKYDAVLFFESFHHCADHLKLIRDLGTMLKPGGIAVFASEPITDLFPVPWGLRLDGMSVWSTRRFKWLELGFKESYFRDTLARFGWKLTKHVCPDTPIGVIFVASR